MAPDILPQEPDERVDAIVNDLNALNDLIVEGTDDAQINERIQNLKLLIEERDAVKMASQEKLQKLDATINGLKLEAKTRLETEGVLESITVLQTEVKTKVNDILAQVEQDEEELEKNPMGYFTKFMESMRTSMEKFKENPIGGLTGMVTVFVAQWNRIQDFWAAKAGPLGKLLKPITGGSSFGVDAPRQAIVDALLKKNPNEKLKGKTIRVIREAMAAMQGQGVDDAKLLEALVNAHVADKIPKTDEERAAFLAPLKAATPPAAPETAKPEPVLPATVDFATFKSGVEIPGYGQLVIMADNKITLAGTKNWKFVAGPTEAANFSNGIRVSDVSLDANAFIFKLTNNGANEKSFRVSKADFIKAVKHMDVRMDSHELPGTGFTIEQ